MTFVFCYIINITVGVQSQNCSVITCEEDDTCKPNGYPKSMQCQYIECCCQHTIAEARIDYLKWVYCDIGNDNMVLSVIILCVIIIYAFILLAMISDQYFAKLMEQLTVYFNLSYNVAGVTFLAWSVLDIYVYYIYIYI